MDELQAARELLGVDEHATRDEVQRAYRAAAKRHHPDAGGDAQMFAAIERGYRKLTAIAPLARRHPYLDLLKSDPQIPRVVASERPTQRSTRSRPAFSTVLAKHLAHH
jgi:curved DNA-binding protein CbpA